MSSVNWGVGWANPNSGTNGNGYGPDTPKDSIQNAINDGFTHIKVAAGTHTISSIADVVTLEFMPGTHTFSNAPVAVTKPINLISSQFRPPSISGAGAAKITAPSSVNAFFQCQPTAEYYGMLIKGLWFDLAKINSGRGAVEFRATNFFLVKDNVGYRTSYGNRYLIYQGDQTGGTDQSWNHVRRNTTVDAGMLWHAVTGETQNRWSWRDCATVNTSPATARPYDMRATRHQGQWFEGITVDGVSADCAAFFDRAHQIHMIGCHGANISNSGNIFMWADVGGGGNTGPASSHFIHCQGTSSAGGTVKAGASYIPPAGAETYEPVGDNRFDIIAARNNL